MKQQRNKAGIGMEQSDTSKKRLICDKPHVTKTTFNQSLNSHSPLYASSNCCFAAGVMTIDDSLPMENPDLCDTVPMFFEDGGAPGTPKDSVFTTGSDLPEVHMPPSISGDHNGGTNGSESVASPAPLVKSPRVLPPVPAFESSKPSESDVP